MNGTPGQRGLSLLETLLALGVATMGIMAILQLTSVGQKSQKSVEAASELNELGASLQQILGSSSYCSSILKGVQFSETLSPIDTLQAIGSATDASPIVGRLNEIDYPMPDPAYTGAPPTPLVPDSTRPFLSTRPLPAPNEKSNQYKGWQVGSMGLRLLGPAIRPNAYLIRVEVEMNKTRSGGQLGSFGGSKGQVQSAILAVTATGSTTKIITDCAPSSWVPITLSGTARFNLNCRYRFKVNSSELQNVYSVPGMSANAFYLYPTGVGTDALIYLSHGGSVTYVTADNKSCYAVRSPPNFTPCYFSVTAIEAQCN